jgi:putative Holliday junction resolvase
MRVLGVDYGTKRIGLAIGESEVSMAFARDFLAGCGDLAKDARSVADYAEKERCDLVLLGVPYLESGEEGDQAMLTRKFANELTNLGVKLQLWDERYTTSAARSKLSHLDPQSRKKVIDGEAARIMVLEFLESGS